MKDQSVLIQNGVDVVKSLELFGDIDTYNESLGDFMAEVSGKLAKIKSFKEVADMPNYAILVHSLKSDAKYFGFTTLAEMAYAHELKSKENNVVFVNENYDALVNEANRIVALVNQYLGVEGAGEAEAQMTTVEMTEPVNATIGAVQSILVVDDSDIIKNFVKKIFANDYNVLTASDGAEAIKIIDETNQISAILLDLNMPNVNGFKVLDYMKENDLFKRSPVSIITGNDAIETDQSAFEYPIVDILKKPFTETSVKNIVEKTVNYN